MQLGRRGDRLAFQVSDHCVFFLYMGLVVP